MKPNNNILLFFILLALALVGIIIFAARSFGLNRNLNAKAPAYEKQREQTYILIQEVKAMQDQGDDLIILDVRSIEDFATEHIEGAVNIPYADISNKFVLLPQSKLIVTMDDGGDCKQGIGTIIKLNEFGFGRVKNMEAGIYGWKEAGYPLVSGPPEPEAISVARVSVTDIKNRLSDNKKFTLIDTRSDEKYQFGHLPTARYIEYSYIKEQYVNSEIPPEQEIIFYDEQELRSSIMATELIKLGASDVKIIEGGYNAWVTAGNTVVTQ